MERRIQRCFWSCGGVFVQWVIGMSFNSLSSIEEEFRKIERYINVLALIVVIYAIVGGISILSGFKDMPNFFVQILNVFIAIIMVLVISYQAKISESQVEIMVRQTKISEVDKLPMLVFQKVDSRQDGETQDKNQENNLNRIENQENSIQAGKLNLAFEIFNVSKYPVIVEYVDFMPLEGYNEIIEKLHEGIESGEPPQAVRLHALFGAKGKLIPPNQKIKVPDKRKGEADITVPGVLRIRASNVYFPDLVLEYEYDTSSGKINRIEGLP